MEPANTHRDRRATRPAGQGAVRASNTSTGPREWPLSLDSAAKVGLVETGGARAAVQSRPRTTGAASRGGGFTCRVSGR